MLEQKGPPGWDQGTAPGWRAVTRVLRSCSNAAQGTLQPFTNDVVNVLFPSECRLCGQPMLEAGTIPVCAACVAGVSAQAGALCPRCGEAVGWEDLRFAQSMGECMTCRLAPPGFVRAVAFAEYDGEIRGMLSLLKFERERSVAERVLGSRLAQAIAKLEPEAARELVVVPVPLFAAKEQERGFNQAALLAAAAVRALKKTHRGWKLQLAPRALRRVKATPPFFSLTPAQRRASLEGAFAIGDAEAVRGREVLLVDDIMTTGTTARACARVLLRGGAAKVWVATVARAQPQEMLARAGPSGDIARWDTAKGCS
jgi:ComF family protein